MINRQPQPLVNEHLILSNEIHINEENSVNEEESPTDEHCLEDALDAMQEINSLVRKIGQSLIKREVAALKRSAQEIAQRCCESIPQGEQQRDDSTSSTPEGASNKRRRVSLFEEHVAEQKSVLEAEKEGTLRRMAGMERTKEALLEKIARLERLNVILLNLNNSHGLMEHEIRDMIDQESREESS